VSGLAAAVKVRDTSSRRRAVVEQTAVLAANGTPGRHTGQMMLTLTGERQTLARATEVAALMVS